MGKKIILGKQIVVFVKKGKKKGEKVNFFCGK
jgi:hypothetical protein